MAPVLEPGGRAGALDKRIDRFFIADHVLPGHVPRLSPAVRGIGLRAQVAQCIKGVGAGVAARCAGERGGRNSRSRAVCSGIERYRRSRGFTRLDLFDSGSVILPSRPVHSGWISRSN